MCPFVTNQEQGREENLLRCGHEFLSQHFGDASFSIVLTLSTGSLCNVLKYELRSVTWSDNWNRTTIIRHIQEEEVALLKIPQTFLRIPLEMKNTSSLNDNFIKWLLNTIQILTILESFCRCFYAECLAVKLE